MRADSKGSISKNMATKWVQPLVGVSHAKRQYNSQDRWTKENKATILELRDGGKTTKEIREIMRREHGFDARLNEESSIAMYKNQFKRWGNRVHLSEVQRRFIIRKRTQMGRMPTFKWLDTNKKIHGNKLQRLWEDRARYGEISMEEALSPCGLRISASSSPAPAELAASPAGSLETMSTSSQESRHPDRSSFASNDTPSPGDQDSMQDHNDPEIELIRSVEVSPRWVSDSLRGTTSSSLAAASSVEGILKDVVQFVHACNRGEKPLPTMSFTDNDVNAFLVRILKRLGIPLNYHLRTTASGAASPLQSFEDWERANYRFGVVPGANGRFILPITPPMSPQPVNEAYPPSAWPVSFFVERDNFEDMVVSIDEVPTRWHAIGQLESALPTSNLEMRAVKLLSSLVGKSEDMKEIETAMAFTRDWHDLDYDEREELKEIRREVAEVLFRARFYRRDICSFQEAPGIVTEVERHLRSYRRLLGPVAEETLDASRDLWDHLFCLDGIDNDRAIACLERAYRGYWKVCGPDHPKTRECLNLIGRKVGTRDGCWDESLVYFHLALNGRVYTDGSPLDNSFDAAALETLDLIYNTQIRKADNAEALKASFKNRIEARRRSMALDEISDHDLAYYNLTAAKWYDAHCDGPEGAPLRRFRSAWDHSERRKGTAAHWKALKTAEIVSFWLKDIGRHEEALELCTARHMDYTNGTSPDMSKWNRFMVDDYIRNLTVIAKLLKDENNYVDSLRLYEQVLDHRLRYFRGSDSHAYWVAHITDRIVEIIAERGPTLYIQPLLHHLVEKRARFWGSLHRYVIDLVLLSGRISLQCSGLAVDDV